MDDADAKKKLRIPAPSMSPKNKFTREYIASLEDGTLPVFAVVVKPKDTVGFDEKPVVGKLV